jgi:hypothetical protein
VQKEGGTNPHSKNAIKIITEVNMPEEIQIRDADGSQEAGEASTKKSKHSTAETTRSALSDLRPERLSLEELNARESRFGARKAMGPPLTETSTVARADTMEEEIPPTEPLLLGD